MSDTNYIGGIVKILETPRPELINDTILFVKFRVQFSKVRQTQIIDLVFWGNLAGDIINYYKINEYILIEGYVSLRDQVNFQSNMQTSKRVEITVLKVYPFLLSYDRLTSGIEDY